MNGTHSGCALFRLCVYQTNTPTEFAPSEDKDKAKPKNRIEPFPLCQQFDPTSLSPEGEKKMAAHASIDIPSVLYVRSDHLNSCQSAPMAAPSG